MPKTTRTATAGCGHTYCAYTYGTGWSRCPDCVTALRLTMQAENATRRRAIRSTTPRPSYYIPRKVRWSVYERDGWVCQLCFDTVDPDLAWPDPWSPTLDHIICRSWVDEPDHSETNLRLAHAWCNSVRGNESHHDPSVLLPPAA